MNNDGYGAIVYGLEKPSGESCILMPRGNGLEIIINGHQAGFIEYTSIKISVSGTDDKNLNFEGTYDGKLISAVTTHKAIGTHIEAIGAPRHVIDQLTGALSTRKKRAWGRRSIFLIAGAVLGIIILSLWGGYKIAIGIAAANIPTDWETHIGRTQATTILEQNNVCADPELNNAVQEIGQRLVVGMGMTPYQWQINILDTDEVNAFALPGGYVFINRGLIEQTDDGNELAGVLAHEFQHILSRHGIKNVVANLGLMLILYAVVGDSGAIEQYLMQNLASLAAMSFSREQEMEADTKGIELIFKSNLDPTGLMRFMDKLANKENSVATALSILSTHPPSIARKNSIEQRINEQGNSQSTKPLSSDWSKIKSLCGSQKFLTPDSL